MLCPIKIQNFLSQYNHFVFNNTVAKLVAFHLVEYNTGLLILTDIIIL